MGVPRLFVWIRKTFQGAVRQVAQGAECNNEVDNLYIDANPILHSVCQEVFFYGKNRPQIEKFASLDFNSKRTMVFEKFFRELINITRFYKPRKVLYIAIDGPAPLAKQAQQRQRRFETALEQNGSHVEGEERKFESTHLTPGTEFMFELTRFINCEIRKTINRATDGWRDITVIFSPPTAPGEGEHKIMDYIRVKKADDVRQFHEESHCFYGPDGDLLMLTLAVKTPRMYLIKDGDAVGYFYTIDIGKIRSELTRHIHRKNVDDAINDFILLGFFVGNDFLPKIRMFLFLEDGLELMLREYNKFTDGKKYLTTNGKINWDIFIEYVASLGKKEPQYLLNQAYAEITDPEVTEEMKEKFKNVTLINHITNYKDKNRAVLDYKGYLIDYYIKAGCSNIAPLRGSTPQRGEDDRVRMCKDYIRNFYWVYLYYTTGLPSWEEYYPWHYAPMMSTFLEVLKRMDLESMKFEMGEPSVPFVQLLSILPPKSSYLLPEKLRGLFDKDSELSKMGYYPDDFEVDYEGITKAHMKVVLLPFVDVKVIRKAYSKIKLPTYTKNTLIFGYYTFHYNPQYTVRYVSVLGKVIENCHVEREFVPY